MSNMINCSLNTCNKQYDWTVPKQSYFEGETLLGDLNFCSSNCSNIWLAKAERESGVYSCTTKEWCDEILAGKTPNT